MNIGHLVNQTSILVVEELREILFRKRSLLSLLTYVGVVALCLWLLLRAQMVFGTELRHLDLNAPEYAQLTTLLNELGIFWFVEALTKLSGYPDVLWIFQVFSLAWFPTLVAMVSCDLVALDIYRGTLRFLMLRTSRAAYYFGKMISHFLLFAVLQLLSLVAVVALASFGNSRFELAPALHLSATYFAVFLPFLWCVVAVTQMVSSWSRKPMSAMVKVHLLWVVAIVVSVWIPWATPLWSKIMIGLLLPFGTDPVWSFVGYTVWGIIFSGIGFIVFARRDI